MACPGLPQLREIIYWFDGCTSKPEEIIVDILNKKIQCTKSVSSEYLPGKNYRVVGG